MSTNSLPNINFVNKNKKSKNNNHVNGNSHLIGKVIASNDPINPVYLEFDTHLLRGKYYDYMILRTDEETSWYEVDYMVHRETSNEVKSAYTKGRKLFLSINLLNVTLFVLLNIAIFEIFEQFIMQNNQITFPLIVFFIFISGVAGLTIHTVLLYTVASVYKIEPTALYLDFPYLGREYTYQYSQLRLIFDQNQELVPNYNHLVTISSYIHTDGIRRDQFAGYSVKWVGTDKTGKHTTGYGLKAKMRNGELPQKIIPINQIPNEDRFNLYKACIFSLSGNLSENSLETEFNYTVSVDNITMIQSRDQYEVFQQVKKDFMRSLSIQELINEIPISDRFIRNNYIRIRRRESNSWKNKKIGDSHYQDGICCSSTKKWGKYYCSCGKVVVSPEDLSL